MIRRRIYNWLETRAFRSNRSLLKGPSADELLGLWEPAATPAILSPLAAPAEAPAEPPNRCPTGRPAGQRAAGSPITEPRTLVFVMTYNREAACEGLLQSIHSAGDENMAVVVVDDASEPPYGGVPAAVQRRFGQRGLYLRARRNLGKAGLWKTYALGLHIARQVRPALSYFLQDDVELAQGFFAESRRAWAAIEDPRKAVLNLITFPEDPSTGKWVRFRRQADPNSGCRLTQWFDLQCFLAGPRFFEVLSHRLFPISPLRWQGHPHLSSGVGRQLTLRLFKRGNSYQVRETLAHHGALPSLMNAQARRRERLDNRPGGSG
jgi:hypothetical protein